MVIPCGRLSDGAFGYGWTFDSLPFSLSFYLRLGQISASLAAMNRTVEDYDSMAKREMIKAKQEKAMMSVFPCISVHSQHIDDLTYVTGAFRSSAATTMNSEVNSNG
jgi:hypothetical protein